MHELQDQDFIAYAPESVLYRTTSEMCRQAGFRPHIAQVVRLRGHPSALLQNFLEIVDTATAEPGCLPPRPGGVPFPTDERLTRL
jgi:hypothetical protein